MRVKWFCQRADIVVLDYKTCAFCIDNPVFILFRDIDIGLRHVLLQFVIGSVQWKELICVNSGYVCFGLFQVLKTFLILYVSFDVFGFRKYFWVSSKHRQSEIAQTWAHRVVQGFFIQPSTKDRYNSMSSLHKFLRKWRNVISNIIEKAFLLIMIMPF